MADWPSDDQWYGTENYTTLNNKFQSVFVREPPGQLREPDYTSHGAPLETLNLDVQEVKDLLKGLCENSAGGPCNIACKVLKECYESLAYPVYLLLKLSYDTSLLPLNWKRGNITGIYKKGRKDYPLNYRPISLTSVLCKLLEKIIRKRVVDHLESNNIFTKHQHGFREKRSCLTALLEFFEAITKLHDEGVPCDSIYLDCQKPFDTMPTRKLILKLEGVGIRGKVLEWIKGFLTGREQSANQGAGCPELFCHIWEAMMTKKKEAVWAQRAWFVAGLGATKFQKYILIWVTLVVWLSMCAFYLWALVDRLS